MGDRDVNARHLAGEVIDPDAPGEVVREGTGRKLAGRFRPVGDWLTTEPPALRWLVSVPDRDEDTRGGVPMMPRGIVALLAATGGVGKTTAALELAVLVAAGGTDAHGVRWLGAFNVAGGPVAVFNAEDTPDAMHRRAHRAVWALFPRPDDARHRERVARDLLLAPLAGTPDLALVAPPAEGKTRRSPVAVELAELLDTDCPGKGWALVVVDPLARWGGPDAETDNAAATVLVSVLETFAEAPGAPAVLTLHHTRKGADGGAEGIRGASGLHDGVRWAATMTRLPWQPGGPEIVRFHHAKSNETKLTRDRDLVRSDGGRLVLAGADDLDRYEEAKAAAEAERNANKPTRRRGNNAPSAATPDDEAIDRLLG